VGHYLQAHSRQVVSNVLSRPNSFPALWHPYGFAVFRLKEETDLGHVRLHIWPEGRRRAIPGHPPIHCHDWDLGSIVLGGIYKETLYDVKIVKSDFSHYLIEVVPTIPSIDGFRGTELRTAVSEKTTNSYEPGEMHFIRSGAFHATNVPLHQFAATLAVTGNAFTRRAILSPLPEIKYRYERPKLTADDRLNVLSQLALFHDADIDPK